MSDIYCTNRHLDVSQHDSCMFVRKCALDAGKLSISCCIYSTAQPWLIRYFAVSRICEIRNAAHCRGSRWHFNDKNYTYLSLGCLDIKRTSRLKNRFIHFESLFMKPNNTYIKRWFSTAMFHLLRKPVGLCGSKRRT